MRITQLLQESIIDKWEQQKLDDAAMAVVNRMERGINQATGDDVEKIIVKSPKACVAYAKLVDRPIPDLEPALLTDLDEAMNYFLYIRKRLGRWPELEELLLKSNDCLDIITYANYTKMSSWSEAEPILANNNWGAYSYATVILKRPWPPGEPIILKVGTYALSYALKVKGVWPQGEADIIDVNPSHLIDEYEDLLDQIGTPKDQARFLRLRAKYNK